MKKVFYLKTCQTNKRIMAELDLSNWELQEIKSHPITEEDLQKMYEKTHSYKALFSRKSTQIKKRSIDVNMLKEENFRQLILEHYSFLKRPVFLTDDRIFIGNEKDNLMKLYDFFGIK